MRVRENSTSVLTGDFEIEITIQDGTDGALRIIPGAGAAATAPLQIEIGVVSGTPTPRVRIDGVWSTL